MNYTYKEIGDMLDVVIDEIPAEYFDGLNGGVVLSQRAKHNPQIPSNQYWVLGEYKVQGNLGRMIEIYYGSVLQVYGDRSEEEMTAALRRVVRHELQHHVESLAGDHTLEDEDDMYVEAANKQLMNAGGMEG